jgi:elongation factor G
MSIIDLPHPPFQDEPLRLMRPIDATQCEGRCVRQTQALGQFAAVTITLTPAPQQQATSIVNECQPVDQSGSEYQGEGIEHFRQGVIRGVTDVLQHYRSLGYDVVDLVITITRMVVHPVDSTEGAFRVAARNALSSGLLSTGLASAVDLRAA